MSGDQASPGLCRVVVLQLGVIKLRLKHALLESGTIVLLQGRQA
jgi:hypothetical protein